MSRKATLVTTDLGRRVIDTFSRGISMHAIAKAERIPVMTVERLIYQALTAATAKGKS